MNMATTGERVRTRIEPTAGGENHVTIVRRAMRVVWSRPWSRAIFVVAVVLLLVWTRNVAAGIYNRINMSYELSRRGTDYRLSTTLPVGSDLLRVKYPYYWNSGGDGRILTLTATRFTRSVNVMSFEPASGDAAQPAVVEREIKAIPGIDARDIIAYDDTTLSGARMRIYRYGVGVKDGEGYQNKVVAIFPKESLKVSFEQYYENGPYIEDDVAMARMFMVLYGLRFDTR